MSDLFSPVTQRHHSAARIFNLLQLIGNGRGEVAEKRRGVMSWGGENHTFYIFGMRILTSHIQPPTATLERR